MGQVPHGLSAQSIQWRAGCNLCRFSLKAWAQHQDMQVQTGKQIWLSTVDKHGLCLARCPKSYVAFHPTSILPDASSVFSTSCDPLVMVSPKCSVLCQHPRVYKGQHLRAIKSFKISPPSILNTDLLASSVPSAPDYSEPRISQDLCRNNLIHVCYVHAPQVCGPGRQQLSAEAFSNFLSFEERNFWKHCEQVIPVFVFPPLKSYHLNLIP